MRRLTLLISVLYINIVCWAQVNEYGIPFITNYSSAETGGAEQNWAIVQDNRGLIYVANQDGVLEYDGNNWTKISIKNKTPYSLAVDKKGVVHVGTENDFGYLYPDNVGTLQFVSLRNLLPDSLNFSSVYRTYCSDDKTYYCALEYIFIEEGDSVSIVEIPYEDSWFSYLVGDSIVISREYNKMSLLYNNELTTLPADFNLSIYGVVPSVGHTYLLSVGDMLYQGTFDSQFVKAPVGSYLQSILEDQTVYYLSKFDENIVLTIVFGNDYSVVVLDSMLRPIDIYNVSNGLCDDDATYSAKIDNDLWVTTGDGISKVEYGSAFRFFGKETGLEGGVKDVIEFNGHLCVATEKGLYYKTNDANGFTVFKPVIKDSFSYSLLNYRVANTGEQHLYVGTATEICKVVGANLKDEKHFGNSCSILFQSKKYPEYFYAGSEVGAIVRYKYDIKRNSTKKDSLDIKGTVISIAEDVNGNMWFSIKNQCIVKYSQNDGTYTEYGEKDGLPSVYQIKIEEIDNRLIFCTEKGLYEYDEEKSMFSRSDILGTAFNDTTMSFYSLKPYKDGFAAITYSDDSKWHVNVIKKDGEVFNTPFNRLPKSTIEKIYVDSDDNLWIGAGRLYCYRPEYENPKEPFYASHFNAHIRKVMANDCVIFGGTLPYEHGQSSSFKKQNEEHVTSLSYKDNSLSFVFSATFFENEELLQYSTMLDGFDDSWSKWSSKTDYSQKLREGKYTFKVKARNIYGVESSVAEYSFIVRPPFYRSMVAYILYFILLVAGVYGIVKWNTHRLIEEKKKLEQKVAEATEEIRGQNVQLEKQKDEIEKQKDEIQASINYARRIQRALLTPDETIDQIFPDHFLLYKPRNVVSGDYYWIGQFGDNKVCIVADCTGHGVPGGFMSMLGMTNLNYIVGQELRPDEILNKLRNAIITSLRQKDEGSEAQLVENVAVSVVTEKKDRSQDGMDVAMYVINEKEMTLSFAGANNPLVLIRDGEVQVVKASKMPVGIYAKLDPFERVDMELKKGDCLYTFSDGFQDQFGQATGRKFMSKHLREVLLEIHQKPMAEQKEILNKTYEDWRGPADLQTDDVVLMGVRIN